jgi:nucleoporin NDC1
MPTLTTPSTSPPPRPYRRFLTSALHKRFVHVALLSLLVGFGNAFWLGSNKNLFWSWFPFGPAGVKALLFSISSLVIFIVQIATLKIGQQTTTSPWATFRSNFLSVAALQTVFWYLFSGFWFTEVYIWSAPDLAWITPGTHNTPDVLNERPIFFRVYALLLALGYAGFHLYRGQSALRIPISKLPATPAPDAKVQDIHPLDPIQTELQRGYVPASLRSAATAGITIVLAPFINGLFLRNTFWQLHLAFAKPFANLSRVNSRPIGYPPLGPAYLLRCFCAGFLLVLTWELSSLLFLTYFKQEPTKSGLPLSATSKDPNGTLLTGLKAKRDVVRAFAFWELAIIAQKHKDRRRAVFDDIERPTGSMWSQMVQAGLNVLKEIHLRIEGPPPPAETTPEKVVPLPRLLPETEADPILAATKPATRAEWLATPLKAFGSTKQPWRPPIEQTAKQVETKLIEYARPPNADKESSKSLVDQWATTFRESPIGWIFTSTNTARINATVLGSPYGNAALVVDVIEALTKMQVASLTEDTYGKATPTVPDTVRTFTKTLNLIEEYVLQNRKGVTGGIEEVDIVVTRLRASLKELLSAFQVYLIDQGLGIGELNQAKKAMELPSKAPQSQKKPKSSLKSAENPTERRLFEMEKPREKTASRRSGREEEPPRIEGAFAWTLPRNNSSTPLFQRREMERVR